MSTISTDRFAVHRTTAMLLDTIAEALNGDGSYIEPDSIDSQGLTVVAGVYRFRIELSEPELMDWEEHSPSSGTRSLAEADREFGQFLLDEERRLRILEDGDDARQADADRDRDWMADTDNGMPF